MSGWSVTIPPEIVYYIAIPLLVPLIMGIFAWTRRREVTAVRQYVLDELKDDVIEMKERIRILELLSPGSLIDERKHDSSSISDRLKVRRRSREGQV